jgi:hypothetical protein
LTHQNQKKPITSFVKTENSEVILNRGDSEIAENNLFTFYKTYLGKLFLLQEPQIQSPDFDAMPPLGLFPAKKRSLQFFWNFSDKKNQCSGSGSVSFGHFRSGSGPDPSINKQKKSRKTLILQFCDF